MDIWFWLKTANIIPLRTRKTQESRNFGMQVIEFVGLTQQTQLTQE